MRSKKSLITISIVAIILAAGGLLTWWFIYHNGIRNAISAANIIFVLSAGRSPFIFPV